MKWIQSTNVNEQPNWLFGIATFVTIFIILVITH